MAPEVASHGLPAFLERRCRKASRTRGKCIMAMVEKSRT